MKRFTTQWLGLLALLLVWSSYSLEAQENVTEQVVVVQKVTLEDGSTTVVKKRLDKGADVKHYIQTLGDADGKEVEVKVFTNDRLAESAEAADGEKVMIFRRAKSADQNDEGMEKFTVIVPDFAEDVAKHEHHARKKEGTGRPILGIYADENHGDAGLKVTGLVQNKGAQEAGIQEGDVITAVNGTSTNRSSDLRTELSKFKPGDQVQVTYTRNGQTLQTDLILSESSEYRWTYERDPCKVFIGVSLSGHGPEGKGIRVTRIIGDTPAEQYGLESGDIITALDGIVVNTYGELLRERNKHEPGDLFTVSVIREGVGMDVEAQFKSCEEEAEEEVEEPVEEIVIVEEKVVEEPVVEEVELVEEVVEKPAEEQVEETPALEIDNTLQLEEFTTFPNPTFGKMRVEFRGESVPTTVQVLDINGRVIHKEVLNQFDGYYNKQLNFENVTPGTLFLNIRQGDKTVTEKIILLTRA